MTGPGAAHAGNAVFLSYILAGLVALLTALIFAEFASKIPKSGSSYTYTYCIFGELAAWVVGWNQIFNYAVTSATMARGLSAYLEMLVGHWVPKEVFSVG